MKEWLSLRKSISFTFDIKYVCSKTVFVMLIVRYICVSFGWHCYNLSSWDREKTSWRMLSVSILYTEWVWCVVVCAMFMCIVFPLDYGNVVLRWIQCVYICLYVPFAYVDAKSGDSGPLCGSTAAVPIALNCQVKIYKPRWNRTEVTERNWETDKRGLPDNVNCWHFWPVQKQWRRYTRYTLVRNVT